MAFNNATVLAAWKQAGGKCECRRSGHGHYYNYCGKRLVWDNRGRESGLGAWEAHHKTSVHAGGGDSLSNCEILCWDCHRKTL